jgi:site-specific DNA recombinase
MFDKVMTLGEITQEQYEKFSDKYIRQRYQMSNERINNSKISSSLEKTVVKGIKIAEYLSQVWISSSFENKQKLQYVLFPEGIMYNKETDIVRTRRGNALFAEIPILTGIEYSSMLL